MGRAVSRRPLTVEDRVPSQVSPCEVYHTQAGIWAGFDFPVSVIPATLRTHLHLHAALTSRTNGLAATFVWRPKSTVQCVRRRNQVVVAAAVTATVRPTAGSFMWPRTDMTSQLTHLLQPCSTSPSTGHP